MRLPLLRLLRPGHWIKNLFVLAPAVFAGLAFSPAAAREAAIAAAAFAVASSLVYVFNDLLDVERDRAHPRKRHSRPIAAGHVSRRAAAGLWGVLLAAVAAAVLARPALAPFVGAFVVLNVLYTLRLKHVAGVDLLCISAGYILRLGAGAAAVAVPLSRWMAVTAFLLTVFLAATKRRQEMERAGSGGRAVLSRYAPALLDRVIAGSAVATLAAYCGYVVVVRPALAVTVPFVVFGLFRYLRVLRRPDAHETPSDVLWRDAPLLATVLAWGAVCAVLVVAG
jgi:4-hydroxybenzoate polyprenyltransferase